MNLRPLLAAFCIVFVLLIFNPAQGKRAEQLVADQDIRDLLKELNLKAKEFKEEDGLTRFDIEAPEREVNLYQYRVGRGEKVISLSLSAGFSTGGKGNLERTNAWNRSQRFSRAYLDADHDPFLTSDLLVADGVTRDQLRTTLVNYIASLKSFKDTVVGG